MEPRSLASHVATAAVTLALAGLLFGDRAGPEPDRKPPDAGPSPADAPTLWSPPQAPEASDASPGEPDGPPDVPLEPPPTHRAVDADEAINVRVYEGVNRSVVNIATSAIVRGRFRDRRVEGSGSGFVIDREGHILTNHHVIDAIEAGPGAVQVGLFDGTVLDAELVGADPSNDVAVLRIDAPSASLFPVPLGSSTGLKVGQKVLAVGNPFGLERTLTTGIISSLDRSLEARNGRTIRGIIQTDAAINPGNSGGPLLNARGEVIGMNTAIYSEVGQSAGIGFAVPIDTIRRVLTPLIERGFVVRASLGVTEVLSLDEGLLIIGVEEGGPADRAGLRALRVEYEAFGPYRRARPDPDSADVILAIGGVRVRAVNELLTAVESHPPGATVDVTVYRLGRTADVPVTLGESVSR